MKTTWIRIGSLMAAAATVLSLAACGQDSETAPRPSSSSVASRPAAVSSAEKPALGFEMKSSGRTYYVMNEDARNMVTAVLAENPLDYAVDDRYRNIAALPETVTLEWGYLNGVPVNSAEVILSLHSDLSDPVTFPAVGNTASCRNLIPGSTYYWQIKAETDDGTVLSDIGRFAVGGQVRVVTINGVQNARDLGGWKTLDGKTMRYGLAYRTARLTDIKEDGVATAVQELGIRTELDLRGEEGLNDCPETGVGPLGKSVNYVNVKSMQYSNALVTKTTAQSLRVFADPANYPILFHCAGGADRTGTIAMLIEAICNCDESVLAADFELTPGRYRTLDFDQTMKDFYRFPGETNREKAVFLCKKLGMTDMELANIYNMMLTESGVFVGDSLIAAKDVPGGKAFTLDLRQSGGVKAVTVDGTAVPWSLNGGELTVSASSGAGTIVFQDGESLAFAL